MKTDVLIIGAGPGGAATALYLADRGVRCTLVEKDQFPRYHIGESLTGECGNCLRELGLEEQLSRRGYPVKYAVTVYGPSGKNAFRMPVMARNAKGQLVEASTWQVPRSEFDALLLEKVRSRGIPVLQGEAVKVLREDGGTVRGAQLRMADGSGREVESRVLVDASGMATFLCNAGVIGPKARGKYDKQVAIFSQVKGALRDPGRANGDTLIFYRSKHQWAWFIPLSDEVVSVGVVVPSDYWSSKGESKRDFLLRELRELNPELSARTQNIALVEDVRAVSNYSYAIRRFTGPGYLCVGDAHRFTDPVFSFGLYFSVKEAQFASAAIAEHLASGGSSVANPFEAYERKCNAGMDVIEDLIDGFWKEPFAFAAFAHQRYREDCIDLFAGRVYADEPSPGLRAIRGINTIAAQPPHLPGSDGYPMTTPPLT